MNITRNDLRNIAIIAHVDHGKTTLVDEMLKQGGVFRQNQQVAERVMDSNDLERERGITILSKNTAVHYNGVKINIVDTPGHADFSGEVERVLKMVSGVLLLVDAFEGPMPQTRFVLKKALELNLNVIIVINKTDRPDARCDEVVDETLELLMDLDASDEQLDSPIVYASGRSGTATMDWRQPGSDLRPLFECILNHIPAPEGDPDAPLQLLISTIDYNDYVGRIGVGRIERGCIEAGQMAIRCVYNSAFVSAPQRLAGLFEFDGLKRVNAEKAEVGDIVAVSGFSDLLIGDTICPQAMAEPLPFVKIDEPTISMTFCVNDSPFAGTEGTYVTSRHLRARLEKEALTDVSLRVEETDSTDSFRVYGRGELHLSILIETMRRQGYEFAVTKPVVLFKTIDGERCEPMERLVCDVPMEYSGAVIDKIGRRRGTLLSMTGENRMRLEFMVPSRGLFGYRSEFLTDTRGEGVMSAVFEDYEPYRGDIPTRNCGALVAWEDGLSTAYALFNIQDRGELFIDAGVKVYNGMIIGKNSRPGDIDVNVCRKKHMTNSRNSAAAEEALKLTGVHIPTLEEAMEFIDEDELVEITPKSIRMRKRILGTEARKKLEARKKQG
uniref:Large ribosomal subunit assembly factor BipA n=1 Tax=uncultured bacterium Contig1578 TaxID=1393460 RepID=W0FQS4_9BACT|nr:GTP-binding protein TypA [uncultured bacterium Contig1578]